MKCSLLPGGGLVLALLLWGPAALAQTRTRSLREGAGAHPGPSVEGRKEATPYENTPRGKAGERPAQAAPGDEGAIGLEPEGAGPIGHEGYRGVAPGGKIDPPHAPRVKTPVRVTWTGFEMKPEGGSRVFVQLTRETPYQVTEAEGGLRVTLRGVRLNLRNNGRTLDTHFFATPVKTVKVSARRGEVTVDIQTRGKPAHSERLEAQGGYQFLLIEFPSDGTATAEPTPTK